MPESRGISSPRNIVVPGFLIGFRSVEPFSAVQKLLSEHLFGGIPFVGEGTGIRDEFPAVMLDRNFLRIRVILYQEIEDRNRYVLEGVGDLTIQWRHLTLAQLREWRSQLLKEGPNVPDVPEYCNLGRYVAKQLEMLPQISDVRFRREN